MIEQCLLLCWAASAETKGLHPESDGLRPNSFLLLRILPVLRGQQSNYVAPRSRHASALGFSDAPPSPDQSDGPPPSPPAGPHVILNPKRST